MLIDDSRRFLESYWSNRPNSNTGLANALANARAQIAESMELLEALTAPATAGPIEPATARTSASSEHDPADFSVHIFAKGSDFGWVLRSPAEELLGRGTAETAHKARVEAFRAGMTYVDHLKGRTRAPDSSSLQ